jgi:hypothetical protein
MEQRLRGALQELLKLEDERSQRLVVVSSNGSIALICVSSALACRAAVVTSSGLGVGVASSDGAVEGGGFREDEPRVFSFQGQ